MSLSAFLSISNTYKTQWRFRVLPHFVRSDSSCDNERQDQRLSGKLHFHSDRTSPPISPVVSSVSAGLFCLAFSQIAVGIIGYASSGAHNSPHPTPAANQLTPCTPRANLACVERWW